MKFATLDIETLNGWPDGQADLLPPGTDPAAFNGLDPAQSTPTSVQLSGGEEHNTLIEVGPVVPVPSRFSGGVSMTAPSRQRSHITLLGRDTAVITVTSTFQLLLETRAALDLLVDDGYELLVGWNSSVFDLPFLADAAARTLTTELSDRITLTGRDDRKPKYERLPTGLLPASDTGVYAAQYHNQRGQVALGHLDAAFAYKDWCAAQEVKWSLKPTLEARGYANPTAASGERLHEEDAATRRRYAMWDVVGLHGMVSGDWDVHNDIFGFDHLIDPVS